MTFVCRDRILVASLLLDQCPLPVTRHVGSCLFWLRREQSGNGGEDGPWLHRLCGGSELALQPPPERVRSAALQERLAKLKKDLEAKTYAAMVHDVTGEVLSATFSAVSQTPRQGIAPNEQWAYTGCCCCVYASRRFPVRLVIAGQLTCSLTAREQHSHAASCASPWCTALAATELAVGMPCVTRDCGPPDGSRTSNTILHVAGRRNARLIMTLDDARASILEAC